MLKLRYKTHLMSKEIFTCAIAFNVHDSSIAFALNNKIILVLEAERVFRIKKKRCNKNEMDQLLGYGLQYLKRSIEDISYVAMTTLNNPYLTVQDIFDLEKQTPHEPYWKEFEILGRKTKTLIVNHHLAHAGVFLSTPYNKSIIISCDGGGDYIPGIKLGECLVVFEGTHNEIKRLNIDTNNFVSGKFYGVCSRHVYGSKHSEGKLMAFASLGVAKEEYLEKLKNVVKELEVNDYDECSIILDRIFPEVKGMATSQTNAAKDFAASVHNFFIEKRLEDIENILNKCNTFDSLILVGGASLNLDLNTRVWRNYTTIQHYIPPCCDDTGQSLGALCILINKVFKERAEIDFPYLGEGTKDFTYTENTITEAVDILLNNGVLIIHNGMSEIGPRALGNRSFIVRPDSLEMKKKLSEVIKQREPYRPVAPIVHEEKVSDYFVGPETSPFMLYRYEVLPSQTDNIVGGVHVDNSARAQTITRTSNPFIYDLIKKFGEKTGVYVILNTSLNLKGDPITNKIEESLEIFEKIESPKGIVYNGELIRKEN